MERNFFPKPSTPRSSKTELQIGGLKTYIYGLDQAREQGHTDLGVLYIAHGRTRSYRDSEPLAHKILHQVRSDATPKRAGLIVVAVDARNHGERKLNDMTNMDWTEGNESHAFYNFMSGISLGGHTSWRVATSPVAQRGKLHGVAIIIGCPKLTSLLLSRLGVDLEAAAQKFSVPIDLIYTISYDKLSTILTDQQRQRWPRALAELAASLDRVTEQSYPRDIPTYILNGKLDPLVPDKFTAQWVKQRREVDKYDNIEYFVQENTGHTCTNQMVDNVSRWLAGLLKQ
uniref:Acyl-protein thioesterase 1 n=1 Tax=Talaromyces marneffei PM1 TaxID=1077442 RepID=A0A093VHW8_TALMA